MDGGLRSTTTTWQLAVCEPFRIRFGGSTLDRLFPRRFRWYYRHALHTVTEHVRISHGKWRVFVMYRTPLLICRYLDEEIGVISRWNHGFISL